MQRRIASGIISGFFLAIAVLLTSVAPCRADATLNGTVYDTSGAIVPNATLRLFSTEQFLQTITDESGKFGFPKIPSGTYELQASFLGFAIALIENVEIGDREIEPLSITLMPLPTSSDCGDQPTPIYEIRRKNVPRLAGVTTDYRSGAPLPFVKINVLKADQNRVIATKKADGKGRFQFADLEAGRYTLRASLKGFGELSSRTFWITPGSMTRVNWVMTAERLIVCN
jgi:hypothetical protein